MEHSEGKNLKRSLFGLCLQCLANSVKNNESMIQMYNYKYIQSPNNSKQTVKHPDSGIFTKIYKILFKFYPNSLYKTPPGCPRDVQRRSLTSLDL